MIFLNKIIYNKIIIQKAILAWKNNWKDIKNLWPYLLVSFFWFLFFHCIFLWKSYIYLRTHYVGWFWYDILCFVHIIVLKLHNWRNDKLLIGIENFIKSIHLIFFISKFMKNNGYPHDSWIPACVRIWRSSRILWL